MCSQGGNYVLVLTAGQYGMVKSSFAGINVKPTTDKSGNMTFRLNESQWQQFQANQAKAAAGQGMRVSECLCVCLSVNTCGRNACACECHFVYVHMQLFAQASAFLRIQILLRF